MRRDSNQPERPDPRDDRPQRWLGLLLDATVIANEARSIDRAFRSAIQRVCEHNGWFAGCARVGGWPRDIWWTSQGYGTPDEIVAVLGNLAEPWATRVMESGEIHIGTDGLAEPGIELPAGHAGRVGGVAAPLGVGGRSMGAIVFFSEEPLRRQLDADVSDGLLRVIAGIGTQMGRVVERWHLLRRVAQESEREQQAIGREIHDGLGQQIVGVRLLAQTFRREMGADAEPYSETWDLLMDQLGQAQEQARALAQGLAADMLISHGESLVDQLEEFAELVTTGHGTSCTVDVRGSLSLPDELTRTQLYRITREAVLNAVRHAGPSRIVITVESVGRESTLEVRDDGTGFDPNSDWKPGLGIESMGYRAELIGAQLEIESEPGRGTVVRCVLERGHRASDRSVPGRSRS